MAERKSVEDDLSYRSSAAFTSNDTPTVGIIDSQQPPLTERLWD